MNKVFLGIDQSIRILILIYFLTTRCHQISHAGPLRVLPVSEHFFRELCLDSAEHINRQPVASAGERLGLLNVMRGRGPHVPAGPPAIWHGYTLSDEGPSWKHSGLMKTASSALRDLHRCLGARDPVYLHISAAPSQLLSAHLFELRLRPCKWGEDLNCSKDSSHGVPQRPKQEGNKSAERR